ncbi:SDR family NAD(P)-dependent oxidoreductase [Mycolicibacterium hodleri]|uniref:SDR family NAD(P)-dependent oxidoreductase n=1 Tax=Mycolicibacterium hodleri TaxID=49897 RepID=A0A502EEF3_9MYCO|nr:SDR family NAD(P)-dependent oxidoreductase [Mycolicibacterium hodleri]TPG35654.1 SDR family NAD(P)-dependent oxidoreductase [Mycolicibacterium hodleri]
MHEPGPGRSETVVVTGASSGIGRDTALRYASRHARLVLASRSRETLQTVANECLAAGAAAVLVQATDIAESDQVQRLFDTATARFGQLDIVIQCAAITAFSRFEDLPVAVFDSIVRTNLLGSANVARCALVHFQGTGTGHLVLIGSLLGTAAAPYQSAYVVSKFGLNGLVRLLRQENQHHRGIRVHGVYPGPVDTPVYQTAANYFGRAPRVPPTAVSPETIVAKIVRATGRRRSSERQVGWMNRPAILAYRLIPSLYDAAIGPFLRAVAFTSGPTESNSGNVYTAPPADITAPVINEAGRPAS